MCISTRLEPKSWEASARNYHSRESEKPPERVAFLPLTRSSCTNHSNTAILFPRSRDWFKIASSCQVLLPVSPKESLSAVSLPCTIKLAYRVARWPHSMHLALGCDRRKYAAGRDVGYPRPECSGSRITGCPDTSHACLAFRHVWDLPISPDSDQA
jgi:hypothetical protein